ncbi:pentatricopeptide repeat-containing protein At5g15280, mitochondrial-like [Eucalyptus grandis]|uniref:pentatricopeptide repeat-containing protein At5g15280, mitochondrial-like n=1 Tax=Eucalyptus grandis TaxID=71139 RepID=UPI0005241E42|nr:pentatricopeptide repeat-containing protein At5g15280, mitochondrial-like [Eucalyptus grandis]
MCSEYCPTFRPISKRLRLESKRWSPRAYELMGSMLSRAGLLREAELLLRDVESQGIPLDGREIFSDSIERYAGVGDFERSLCLRDKMSSRGWAPSRSCFYALIELSIRRKKSRLALRVSLDMIESGISFNAQKVDFGAVVKLLCEEGEIQEARNLVKKATGCGYEPCSSVLYEIVCAYCEKKDFEDLLSFFVELNRGPDLQAGNRMINALCLNSGSERANLFRRKLEKLGFKPDEIAFGILIDWCCREGNLKGALVYLAEVLGRGLKPDICSYNAIISAVFKDGMWEHARDILDEMIEECATPKDFYKIFLAGYCKGRKFDEVRTVVDRMMKLHLIQLSSTEGPLSKAFTMLGFGPLDVKLKRDSDAKFSRTEFYDSLGNGLHLEADIDEFDKRINGILDDSFLPDFNSLIMKQCRHGNLKYALRLVGEMVHWGQKLSLSVLSAIIKGICITSYPSVKCIDYLLEKMPRSNSQLDAETLNLLVQFYSKSGRRQKARILLDGMQEQGLAIENKTYNIFMTSLSEQ